MDDCSHLYAESCDSGCSLPLKSRSRLLSFETHQHDAEQLDLLFVVFGNFVSTLGSLVRTSAGLSITLIHETDHSISMYLDSTSCAELEWPQASTPLFPYDVYLFVQSALNTPQFHPNLRPRPTNPSRP